MNAQRDMPQTIDDPPDDDDADRGRNEQPQSPEDVADRDRRLLLELLDEAERDKTSLQAIITELENERGRRNWRQLTERIAREKKDAEIWCPLTMAAIGLFAPATGQYPARMQKTHYERLRAWCEDSKIIARQDGTGHWLVEMNSARAHATSKGM
jgi:hypothetical protein